MRPERRSRHLLGAIIPVIVAACGGQATLPREDAAVLDVPVAQDVAADVVRRDVASARDTQGLLTALFRWEPGTQLPLHEHVEIEQTYVLSGSIVDDEGEVREGDYVWRPRGNRHLARSPGGALVLSFFLKPNKFLEGAHAGKELK